jgi:cytochrome P450
MTVQDVSDVYFDPYDVAIDANPYPTFRRMREEAPLYYNEPHDFYALSRFADVEKGLLDPKTFVSGKGGIIELIRSGMEMPSGVLIFEDPPVHTIHRRLMSRVFTPRRVAELEPKIREYCVRCLDQLVGAGEIDFVADFGAQLPMRVIGMLLGVPDQDQEAVRDAVDANLRTEAGKPMVVTENFVDGSMFGEYIEWREKNPSDDIMTELLQAEFEDEHGTVRKLTRDELLTYLMVVAGAGNETTTKLIGWTGKVLAEHPEQRRELVDDRTLIPGAIEELLRYETPAPHMARVTSRQVELQGQTVKEGSIVLMIPASANHDDLRFPDGDTFDIHRRDGNSLTFGFGIHLCLGAALARMEGQVALDELLNRFPTWEVDMSRAVMAPASTVRGWETLPATIP